MAKRKKRKRRLKLVVIMVLVIGIGGGYGYMRFFQGKGETPVSPVSLKKGVIVDRLTETGKVEHEKVVEVKSAISGLVKTLSADDGQMVKQNEVMAIIEPDPDQALRLSEKAVSVRRFKIIWEQKEKQYERLGELYKKQIVSKEQLEDAKDELDVARYNYQLSQLELSILEGEVIPFGSQPLERNPADEGAPESQIELQDFKVQAPLAGVVLQRNVEEGDMVIRGTSSYTQGTTLFRIGDPRKIIVSSGINEIDVPRLSVGMPVKIIPNADEQRTYRGEIEKISPDGIRINDIVYYRVEILVLKPDSFLKQGMTCDVDIVLGEKEDVYYLPVEAVLKVYKKDREGKETKQIDRYEVYRKTGTRYEKAEVTAGLRSETRMEIVSGLTPEDKVHPDAEKMAKKMKQKKDNHPGAEK